MTFEPRPGRPFGGPARPPTGHVGALDRVRAELPAADARLAPARALPFADGAFDLVFTTGVLLHRPPADLPRVMDEIVRCSRRCVRCGECRAEELEEVLYRGQRDALAGTITAAFTASASRAWRSSRSASSPAPAASVTT